MQLNIKDPNEMTQSKKWVEGLNKHFSKEDIHMCQKAHEKMFSIISSVQFSRSVVSDSLRPHELQHARSPCPSPTPRVHSEKEMQIKTTVRYQH